MEKKKDKDRDQVGITQLRESLIDFPRKNAAIHKNLTKEKGRSRSLPNVRRKLNYRWTLQSNPAEHNKKLKLKFSGFGEP